MRLKRLKRLQTRRRAKYALRNYRPPVSFFEFLGWAFTIGVVAGMLAIAIFGSLVVTQAIQ